MKFSLIGLLILIFVQKGISNNVTELTYQDFSVIVELQNDSTIITTQEEQQEVKKVKFKRGKAIIFTVLTGFLGGHRIYLGTHHRTPIIYSVTLGGLGILPVVDLINNIFTKDINKFDNKTQIIMWAD